MPHKAPWGHVKQKQMEQADDFSVVRL